MAKTTHAQRVLIGRLGAYTVHSRYDSRELIRPAREAFWSKFEHDVDPDGVLPLGERLRRADMARKGPFHALGDRECEGPTKAVGLSELLRVS